MIYFVVRACVSSFVCLFDWLNLNARFSVFVLSVFILVGRVVCRYYINSHTGKTQWEKPSKAAVPTERKRDRSPVMRGGSGEEEVQVLHLLKKHRGSRRPASWRNPNITITKDEAEDLVRGLREQIAGADDVRAKFEELATVESDCSSAKRGGDLGPFGRGRMMPSFEKASFELQPGEMSGLVETDSGVHIIYRVA
uniref:Peptidyl-prolyl cis-trans isomerase n=1 Tax=Chloropicon primus TaxID=1764295 RepID=A0A7S2T3U2_9CHLO|mmetsp:Transcript_4658/g.13915  ORF Transcript_4658/g.13915 Transcript_4658/m.13915 type:complete len:196 (+) Transcript_4658:350-937(+)